tara:strand:+ start:953 stop:1204 length:252 start_codon:yes stop_codon:yes gene_type:complete
MDTLQQECRMPIVLAYLMLIYIIASIFYLLATRSIGTPFSDSLTPEQIEIKSKSSRSRSVIFTSGILGGILLLLFIQPFKKCQ